MSSLKGINKMEVVYKLTDADGYTRRGCSNEIRWQVGEWHEAVGNGGLCTAGVIHAYRSPLLAMLLNPVHAAYTNPQLWCCEAETVVEENADKVGVRRLRVMTNVPVPELTSAARVRFALRCALAVYSAPDFVKWAQDWLSGNDRTEAAAWAAVWAARAAVWAARAAALTWQDLQAFAEWSLTDAALPADLEVRR